jgi:ribonuclease VapC
VILDSSAVIAALLDEPDASWIVAATGAADEAGVGSATLAETGIVLHAKLGPSGRSLLGRFLEEAQIEVVAFTADHWPVAVDAYARYGRGRHRAALNFGDCLTYATAALATRPLLVVGDDFRHTDLETAGPPPRPV